MVSAEEKIILATIECIERVGIEKTTIRQIGITAGVNSAAISYYFRNKDVLMQRVMDIAIGNAFDMENFKDSIGLPINERISFIMDAMIAGALEFPNLTRAFFSELLIKPDYNAPIVVKCNAFLDTLRDEIIANPEKEVLEIKKALMQIASATFLFPGMFPNFFTSSPEINMTDEKIRKAYVLGLVDKLLS